MTRKYTAKEVIEVRQVGGINGHGGKLRKVAVALVLNPYGMQIRRFVKSQGGIERAEAVATELNEKRGLA